MMTESDTPTANFELAVDVLEKKTAAHLSTIAEVLRKPAGFSSLSIEERKFALAALLSSVVPADGKIKPCELEKLETLLASRMHTRERTTAEALMIARRSLGSALSMNLVASRLPDMFGIDDRCNLIGMLWDVAMCDHELHPSEEAFIFSIADQAAIPRKKVIEQQAKSAANVI
jgi:uncharacterized tellurite resistance protein B-like protein